jgi:hypothetical protein
MAEVLWEYRVLPITGEVAEGGAEALEPLLDELGAEGWELVAVDSSAESTYYVFKKRLRAVREEGDYEDDEEYGDEDYDDDDYDEDGTVRINTPGGRI